MSLRTKIVLIVTGVVALYSAGDHLLQRRTLLPSFAHLERVQAHKDLARAIEAIRAEIDYLDLACRDRATSDEAWAFVTGEDPEGARRYLRADLGSDVTAQDEIDLLYVCDPDGYVLWGEVRDWRSGQALSLRDLPRERLSLNHPYLVSANVPRSFEVASQRGFVSGLVLTEHGPMLLAARPILHGDGRGAADEDGRSTVGGTMILGRFLNQAFVNELSERNTLDITVWPVDSPDLPTEELAVLPQVTSTSQPVAVERGDDQLDIYTTLQDLRSAPSLLVRARIPREIWAQGTVATRYALLSTLAAGLLMLLVLLTLLQRLVLSPIGRLTQHAVLIGQTEDSSAAVELDVGRRDEIGILAREFDSMLQKLAASRAAVVETARRSGMSEIANGILHNVGNVLNSVNVSAGLVAEQVRSSKAPRLQRLAGLVREHADDLGGFITRDPRGKSIAPYLSELSNLMAVDQEQMASEVAALTEGIEHIRRLVSSHQAYAGRSGLRESVDLRKTLEQALQISAQASQDPTEVDVEWKLEDIPRLRLDRHRLLEVLVNLLKNAREALADHEGRRCVRLAARRLPVEAGRERLVLEVSDSGPGIRPEDLTQVFRHGFSTKPGGHGFGLHSSANAIKELGGSLAVRSPGELGGATFEIDLPLESPAMQVAPAGESA